MVLTDDQLRAEWARYKTSSAGWEDWRRNYLAAVRLAHLDPATFDDVSTQRKLWSAEDAMSSGLGKSVNVDAALARTPLIEALRALRDAILPTEPAARAHHLQQEYERVLGLVVEAGVSRRPRAKLQRYFALILPAEFTCALSDDAFEAARDKVLGHPVGMGRAETHVHIRARLRATLGDETDDAARVDRSIFCWWLYRPLPVPGIAPPPPLNPWAFNDQYKGTAAVRGYGEFVRQVVREAREPITADELFDAWRTRNGDATYTRDSFVARLSLWKGLGLLDKVDERWVGTPDGHRVLDDDELLIQRLMERVYGFALIVTSLHDATDGLSKDALHERMRSQYPNWTANRVPDSLRAWLDHFGLVTRALDGRWRLTEDGLAWYRRIPRAKDPPPQPPPVTPPPTLLSWTYADIASRLDAPRLVTDHAQLRALHAGWRALSRKHFVLLTGLSGTGKTLLALRYARAVCDALGLAPEQHIALIAVSPEWHDPTALLGYVNPLRNRSFHAGAALPLLLHAAEEPHTPHFLILDEMNLAPVERYFAPFLSAMETGEPLALHHEDDAIDGVAPQLLWPSNLFVAGTVNMDETTHAFSDKVLDRAFTVETWDVDLDALFLTRARSDDVFVRVTKALRAMHDALRPARRHFGYRSAHEVIEFVTVGARECGDDTAAEFLDAAVLGKVLPRVRGDDSPAMRQALRDALSAAKEHALPRTHAKLEAMAEQLTRTGITKFNA